MLMAFGRKNELSVAWGRIFYLYGPFENPSRFMPSIIADMLSGRSVKCSHGNQIRDFMYVEDVAAAFVALLDADVDGAVNIASGNPERIREIVKRVATATNFDGDITFGAIAVPKDEPPILIADTKRLFKEVCFLPQYSLIQGISKTVEWLKQK